MIKKMDTSSARKFLEEWQINKDETIWDSKEIEHSLDCLLEEYHQSKLKNNGDLGDVINSYKPDCSECGDRGWLYNEDGSKKGICTCHY